ncbi:hypothetical protein N5J44_06180 [Acinetobacter ursingii]|uniref:hypothetical protein n=1 Tax=Acinetobacter ursingii TaxID=108980 RepID=UPI0024482F8A|nr:hypothetical protein [Acinetobacter ursingii]MDH2018889.1 hypothetical protein [Acinetobacter ursingii]MDH2071138.1 hypothetical protein [Acinetobacter ursingii]
MKKIILLTLLTCCSTAFAEPPQIIFKGKSIVPTDNRASLIKKLGQPSSGDQTYSYWDQPNYSISASYNQQGLKEFGLAQMNSVPTNVQLKAKGQTITLGKDTINTAVKKFKHGCFDVLDTKFNKHYTFFSPVGEGSNIYVVMTAEYTGKKSSSANKPIFGLTFTSEQPEASEGCNY